MGEQQLAEVAERVAPVLDPASVFAFVVDPDGRVVWANEATRSGFGELAGATVLGVVALRLRPLFHRRLEEVVAGTATGADFDTITVDVHGNQAAVGVTLDRFERGGDLAGVLALLRVPPTPVDDDAELASLRSAALSLLAGR